MKVEQGMLCVNVAGVRVIKHYNKEQMEFNVILYTSMTIMTPVQFHDQSTHTHTHTRLLTLG